jgi:hypothetical protein
MTQSKISEEAREVISELCFEGFLIIILFFIFSVPLYFFFPFFNVLLFCSDSPVTKKMKVRGIFTGQHEFKESFKIFSEALKR